MIQTFVLVACFITALFGASNASPYEMHAVSGMGGPNQTAAMQEALINFKNHCVKVSGSDAGYRVAIASISSTMQCITESVDTLQFIMDLAETPDTSEARKSFIDKYCPAFNETVACFDDYLEGAAMCGNDKALKSVFKKMIHNMIDLMCKNNGQVLIDVRKPEFRTCLQHVMTNIQQCKVSDFIREIPISQFGAEECSELKRSKQCLHDLVSTCTSTIIEDMVNTLFDPIVETANCKLYVQTEVTENEI